MVGGRLFLWVGGFRGSETRDETHVDGKVNDELQLSYIRNPIKFIFHISDMGRGPTGLQEKGTRGLRRAHDPYHSCPNGQWPPAASALCTQRGSLDSPNPQ